MLHQGKQPLAGRRVASGRLRTIVKDMDLGVDGCWRCTAPISTWIVATSAVTAAIEFGTLNRWR